MDLGVGQVPGADAGTGQSGAQAPLGMPPGLALGPGRGGLEPQPGGQHRADVRQARQRRAGGGVAEPGGSHAAGVSQHQAGPGPSRPVAANPARRHRAVIARSRAGCAPSAAASRS